MKELVKNIETAITPIGGALILEGEKHVLIMGHVDPGIIVDLSALASEEKEGAKEEIDRLPLPFILQRLIPKDIVKEVYINTLKDDVFSAEITLNREKIMVIPSVGILIARVTGAPIYFKSEFGEKKEKIQQKLGSVAI